GSAHTGRGGRKLGEKCREHGSERSRRSSPRRPDPERRVALVHRRRLVCFQCGNETDYLLVIVPPFFVVFFFLFFFVASYSLKDQRWPSRSTGLREFLTSEVAVGSGKMSGRDVLIETTLLPVALAFAATLIGLAWAILALKPVYVRVATP